MRKLTKEDANQIYQYIKWYIPTYNDNWQNTPGGLSREPHKKVHHILLDIRREEKRFPLNQEFMHRNFRALYALIGDWLAENHKWERHAFRKFWNCRPH
jgi:hypothetical protein